MKRFFIVIGIILFNQCIYAQISTDSIRTDSITRSLNQEDTQKLYRVYPNPAQHTLYVIPNDTTDTIAELYIYDMTGNIRQIAFRKNDISVHNLPVGTYILQVRQNGTITTYRFMKE